MNTAKKWMLTLQEDHYSWLKIMNEETGVGGSEIIGELINRVRKERSGDFKNSLIAAKTRLQLIALEDKKNELEEEIQALKNKVVRTGDRVTA